MEPRAGDRVIVRIKGSDWFGVVEEFGEKVARVKMDCGTVSLVPSKQLKLVVTCTKVDVDQIPLSLPQVVKLARKKGARCWRSPGNGYIVVVYGNTFYYFPETDELTKLLKPKFADSIYFPEVCP